MPDARARGRSVVRRARGALPRLGPRLTDDDAEFESRLVWILGMQRTGSSWLLRLISYPLTSARSPTGVHVPRHPPPGCKLNVVPINESQVCDHLTPLVGDTPPYTGPREEDHARFIVNGVFGDRPSYFLSDEYSGAWRPKMRELILARLRAQAERATREHGLDDPLVVIKEPQSHGAELLMSLLPRSRLVFLLRDGREIMRSLLAMYLPGGTLESATVAPRADSEESRASFVFQNARLWLQRMNSVQRAYDAHEPSRRIIIRYEDLLDDTRGELERLSAWMALARGPGQIHAAIERERSRRGPEGSGRRATRGVDPGLWELGSLEQQVVDEVMGAKLRELGYGA